MDNQTLYLLAIILSLIASILAWIAKLTWAKEYKDATKQLLDAKDSENKVLKERISFLNDLSSEKIKAIAIANKEMLEEEIDKLKDKLGQLNSINEQKEKEIKALKDSNVTESIKLKILEKEKNDNLIEVNRIENKIQQIYYTPQYLFDFNKILIDKKLQNKFVSFLDKEILEISKSKNIDKILILFSLSVSQYFVIQINELVNKLNIPIQQYFIKHGTNIPALSQSENIIIITDTLVSGHYLSAFLNSLTKQKVNVICIITIFSTKSIRKILDIEVKSFMEIEMPIYENYITYNNQIDRKP